MEQQYCTVCHFPIAETFFFCPNCGKKIHEPPPSTSVVRQIGLYALSIFLPPFGLWPGIKYLKSPDQKTRMVGWVAIILTILSTGVTVIWTMQLMNTLQSTIQEQMLF